MQNQKKKQEQFRQAKDWRVGRLLWEVICSTLLTSRAEQSVVQQIIGETLIQESLLLHREALALRDILTFATSKSERSDECAQLVRHREDGIRHAECAQPPPRLRSLIKDGHESLLEHTHPVRANPPRLHRHNLISGDGRQARLQPSAVSSEDARTHHKMQLSYSHHKTYDGKECKNVNVDGLHRLTKAKKDEADGDGISRLIKNKKDDVNGEGIHTLNKVRKEHAHLPLSNSSSASSSSSDKMQISVKNSVVPRILDHIVNDSGGDVPTCDFSTLLRERGDKINAYDVDEVVHELHEAFATERDHLNQLIEQLRRALDECVDSYSMVRDKPGIDHSQDIQDQVKHFNEVETRKKELPRVVKTPTHLEGKRQVAPKRPSSQASYLSKPSSVPMLKNTKVQKPISRPSSATLSKTTIKTHKPSSKHGLAPQNTNELPVSVVKEGKKATS